MHQNTSTHLDFGSNEGGTWQDRWENNLCLPTQRSDVPSIYEEKNCLNPRSGAQWHKNLEMELQAGDFFQTVILPSVQLVTDVKNIYVRMDAQLASWNHGTFEKLVYDAYAAATGYLGRSCVNKMRSNVILCSQPCSRW